jgi:S1-C subfamily serine protease
MPLTITCPSCGAVFPNVPESFVGKSIRCKKCTKTFAVQVATVSEPPLARLLPDEPLPSLKAELLDPPAAPADVRVLDDDDEIDDRDEHEDRPVRRREPAPKKSNPMGLVVKALIVVVLLGVIGGAGFVIFQYVNKKDEYAGAPTQPGDTFTNFPKQGGAWVPPAPNDPTNKAQNPNPAPKVDPKADNTLVPKPTPKPDEPKPPEEKLPQPVKPTEPVRPIGPKPTVGTAKDAPDEATLIRVKASTVYLEVDNGRGGGGTGTGWFAFEPGLIVTNAHVIGMKHLGSKPPAKVSVFLNSGTDKQQLYEGPSIKILGVDHENDLAILQIVNPGNALPAPLAIRPSSELRDLDKLVVLGFPGGRRLSERNGSTKAPVISTTMTQVSAFRNDDSGLRRSIQLQGGVNHGSSGGPLLDMDGNVVGVPVRVDHNHDGNLTNIAEAIPSEWVSSLAEGRPGNVEFGYPYYKGDQLFVPLKIKCVDPLKKISNVEIGTWIGNSTPATRNPGPKYIEQSGDVGYKEVALKYSKDTNEATGELVYPRDADGRVYWMQPSLTSLISPKKLLKGEVLSFNDRPPVERATVVIAPKYEYGKHAVTVKQTATFTETTTGTDKEVREKRTLTNELRLNESIEKTKLANEVAQLLYKINSYSVKQTRGDADSETPKFVTDAVTNLKNFNIKLAANKNGEAIRHSATVTTSDMAKTEVLNRFAVSTSALLESAYVRLPGQSTAAPTTYNVNVAHTLLLDIDDMVYSSTTGKRKPVLLNETWEVTYLGRRDRAGRIELVLSTGRRQ